MLNYDRYQLRESSSGSKMNVNEGWDDIDYYNTYKIWTISLKNGRSLFCSQRFTFIFFSVVIIIIYRVSYLTSEQCISSHDEVVR